MTEVASGMLVAGYLFAALFFGRFWAQSRDRLFALFAAAFVLLAVQRLALTLSGAPMEEQTVFYLLRLFAFAVIAFAILDKNRR